MMSFESLWTALRAAEQVAETHGLTVDARIRSRPQEVAIWLRDGSGMAVSCFTVPAIALEELAEQRLVELVEQGVASVLSERQGGQAS